MRNFLKRLKSSKVLVIGMVVTLCFAFTGCSKEQVEDREKRIHGFYPYRGRIFGYIEKSGVSRKERYSRKNWKEKIVEASFQEGYGETRASNLWEYSWMQEWLNTYTSDSERAEKALNELEKAFDMAYMEIKQKRAIHQALRNVSV